MAEDGGEFGHEDPDLDNRLDHDADDVEQEAERTKEFNPYASSTPYHGGEQIEMHTMQQERSGLPDISLLEDTPLLGDFIHSDDKPYMLESAKEFISRKFPNVKFDEMDPIGFRKKPGKDTEIFSFGSRGVSPKFS